MGSGVKGGKGDLEGLHIVIESILEEEEQDLDESDAHLAAILGLVPVDNRSNVSHVPAQNKIKPILKVAAGSKLVGQVANRKVQIMLNPRQKVSAGGGVLSLKSQVGFVGLARIQDAVGMTATLTWENSSYAGVQDESEANEVSKSFMDEDDSDYEEAVDSELSSSFPQASDAKDLLKTSFINIPLGVTRMVTRSKSQVPEKFQFKLKRIKAHFKWWNAEVFGNIFENVNKAEEAFELAKNAFDFSPTMENKIYMAKCQASLFHMLDMEEIFWKQKASAKWLGEGERNNTFFHNMASGAHFFEEHLMGEYFVCDSVSMDVIWHLVSLEENQVLLALPSFEELKQVVWEMFKDSAAGSDDFSVVFYVACWDIIKENLYQAVLDFFQGDSLPKENVEGAEYSGVRDCIVWKSSLDGRFSMKSTWQCIWESQQQAIPIHGMGSEVRFGVLEGLYCCGSSFGFLVRSNVVNTISVVRWKKSKSGTFKLNMDCCLKGNLDFHLDMSGGAMDEGIVAGFFLIKKQCWLWWYGIQQSQSV
ncbi:hypothetical protein ZIOFF_028225 [Zingiber officinale]|uniref:Uncharacterized protein n=1 Tax=Zingiber officinale TaxID=94328 RepID=A0A8J5GUK7_ZINOF|nr:hypothetical protein ZIOFF_028225 [Zingiber officinale]